MRSARFNQPYAPEKPLPLEERNCEECRALFRTRQFSTRRHCDDCLAAIDPRFARDLADIRAAERARA
jgi:hypothetical protein